MITLVSVWCVCRIFIENAFMKCANYKVVITLSMHIILNKVCAWFRGYMHIRRVETVKENFLYNKILLINCTVIIICYNRGQMGLQLKLDTDNNHYIKFE